MDCDAFNEFFMEAEQYISDGLDVKRNRVSNAYWGKVPNAGTWDLHQGVTTVNQKLTAYGFGQHDVGWTPMNDSLCDTDLCSEPTMDRANHAGWEEISFGLERYGIVTDWICLETAMYRKRPLAQLQHLENYLQDCTAYNWNEWLRSRYIEMCDNKMVAFVAPSDLDNNGCCGRQVSRCADNINYQGFTWERRPEGTIDERYLRVNCRPEELYLISDLHLDMLDTVKIHLEAEDDNYPWIDEGFPLLDVIASDIRQNIRFAESENHLMDRVNSYGGYDPQILKRTLGSHRVWRDSYSIRYDRQAPRFYPDKEYNDALTAPYDPTNPSTWARLKRVFPTVPMNVPTGTGWGVKHVPNKAYMYAPFTINVVFTPTVMSWHSMPTPQSVSKATVQDSPMDYAGQVKWINPDWPCNLDRIKGFFRLKFGAAAEPKKTEYGYAILTRMNHSINLVGVDCQLPNIPDITNLTAYCHEGLAGEEAILNGTWGANKASPTNSYGLW